MIRSFKIRLFPTKDQEQLMWKHINGCRYIYNLMLEKQINNYKNNEKYLSSFTMNKMLTIIKKQDDLTWLNEISARSLQIVCSDLNRVFQKFFNKTGGFPKFKSKKKCKNAFPVSAQTLYFIDCNDLRVENFGKIKYKTDYIFKYGLRQIKILNARISKTDGKWMLSFGTECENQAPVLTDKPMGIDLGIKETMVVAYGNESIIFHNINKSKKVRELKKRIRNLQRVISRKYEANRVGKKYIKTNNIIKLENKLIKLYARLNGIRHNYIHQCTHKLISLLPCRVIMEDLNVVGMMKNKHLSKAIQEQCFYEIIRQMKYKCEWNGIPFIQVDRFYPSSKTCSCCGAINKRLTLSDRTFICPECGFTIDRDYQAALNLMRYEV